MKGARLAVGLLVCVAGARAARAIGEREGQIRGRVTEAATDAPVPGAGVSATSPALIGPPRTTTTDEEGGFLLPDLPGGVYTVRVNYAGVKPMIRKILVEVGRTAPLNIRWSAELAEAETTVVQEIRRYTNPDSTQTGAVLSIDAERYLPTGRSYQDITRQVPGVSSNVLTGAGNHFIKGGLYVHNRYLVDGLDTTDPVTQTFSQNLAFDSLSTVQVLTGGYEAQYNAIGGVINTITREGSDQWRAIATFFLTNEVLNQRTNYGVQLYEREKPFNDDPISPSSSYNVALNLGGPILKHRLWFNTSFEFRYSETGRLVGPPLNLPHVPATTLVYLPRLKLTWAPTSRQRVTVSLSSDPAIFNNTSGSNGRLSTYETHQDQGGYNGIISWGIFSPHYDFHIDAGVKTQYINTGPQGYYGTVDTRGCDKYSPINCRYDKERPTHVNATDNTVWYNANSQYSLDSRYNIQVDPTFDWRGRALGVHAVKIGVQNRFILRDRKLHRPGGVVYSDRNGPALEDGLCDLDNGKTAGCFERSFIGDRSFSEFGASTGVFLQDKWRPLRWLTVVPGIRFDYGYVRGANKKKFSSLFGVGPRLGLIADITGDQRTIFSASYGRSNEVVSILAVSSYDQAQLGEETFERWNPMTSQFEFNRITGGAGVSINKNLSTPHSDEITSSLRREIFRNAVAGVEYTWKRIANTWTTVESNRVWDITGFRAIDYVSGEARSISLYTTPDDNIRTYQGVTFSFEGRPTPNWQFLGFYTLAWLYGVTQTEFGQGIDGGNAFANPRQRKYYSGFLPEDQRHEFRLATSYSYHGFTVGAQLTYTSGQPRSKYFTNITTNSLANLRSPIGTEPGTCSGGVFIPATTVCGNDTGRISEFRAPTRTSLDLHVEYDFHELLHQQLALTADIFNVFNDRSGANLGEDDIRQGSFGQAASRFTALNMRLGIRYEY